jgi:DNA-binding MarR family transcriptional regulator
MDTAKTETARTGTTVPEPMASKIERTADQVRRITKLLRQGSQEDWTSLSLSRAQLRILVLLQREGSAAVGQLAAALGVTLPSVTATVDRLVHAGLVSREDDPNDRRRVINRLTPAGLTLLERLQEGRRARLVAALERLAPNELEALVASLDRFETALRETGNEEPVE